jgi:hypothetical protein
MTGKRDRNQRAIAISRAKPGASKDAPYNSRGVAQLKMRPTTLAVWRN